MLRLSIIFSSFLVICQLQKICIADRSFKIDYDNNQFLKDGKPFRYISGSLHYFRVPRIYWQDRMERMYAAGLNALQTYIDWSQHEPTHGNYNFTDNLDLIEFIKTAQKVGLLVILRPGPFIDAERDFGGFPFWLLQKNPSMKLRTNDSSYTQYVDSWFKKVMPMVKPYLYGNGGPIISVQVENEYGSYACDYDYTSYLRDLLRSILGNDVVLFTTDPQWSLKCGNVQNVYATVDFGSNADVDGAFNAQRQFAPKGPLVNSEYYPGWLDYWTFPHDKTPTPQIISTLNYTLSRNASVNIYMFHGGTNFGFTNGANLRSDMSWNFAAIPTSYDYNAPISEAGDLTEKYFAIRNLLANYVKLPPGPVPDPIPKYAYGSVEMKSIGSLFDVLPHICPQKPVQTHYPVTFESLGQAYGFLLYETIVTGQFMDPVYIDVEDLRDRAIVFVDEVPVGVLSRQNWVKTLQISIQSGLKLSLLVENMGRVCFGGGLSDPKGLLSNVTLGGKMLTNWNITQLPLNDSQIALLGKEIISKPFVNLQQRTLMSRAYAPGFFAGSFVTPNNSSFPMDTYLNATGWSKGVAFVNGFNIGRYWPGIGPQVTLYVPKSTLKPYPTKNELLLFELEHAPCYNTHNDGGCIVEFVDKPLLNSTTPN